MSQLEKPTITATLLTRNKELVHKFEMIPFQLMPEVCFWGSRVFILEKPFAQTFGKPAEPIYIEVCAWSADASDMLMGQQQILPSVGDGVH